MNLSKVFAIACVGTALPNLDLFSVNIALPRIAAEFKDAPLEDLSWVLNGYGVTYAALLVFFGRLTERHRRDRSFMLGIALFAAASAASAGATGVWSLVVARVVAAAGAAMMTPTSIGLLLATFPSDRRGAAVRQWAGIGGLAAALGPLIGGLLVSFDWRWVFVANALFAGIGVLVAWRHLPAVPGHDIEPPSLPAALMVTAGIGSLVFTIVKVNAWGWQSTGIVASSSLSLVMLTAFVVHSLRAANPLVDPKLLTIRPYAGAALAIVPYSVTFDAMLFSVAIWGQSAWGWSALQAGLAIIPGPLMVPLTSTFVTGRMIERLGAAYTVSVGVGLLVTGFVFWSIFIGIEPNMALIVFGMLLNGIGVGLVFPALMGTSTQALPPAAFATGSGLINMLRQAGIAIGVAAFIAIVGAPPSLAERLAVFRAGWLWMALFTLLTLVPVLTLMRQPAQRAAPRAST